MIFTDFTILDPILSIGISCFIAFNCFVNLKNVFDVLTEKAPTGIDVNDIITDLKKLEGIVDVHHVHIWSLDGVNNYSTMHIVSEGEPIAIKGKIRKALKDFGVNHITIELETTAEQCTDRECAVEHSHIHHHSHHH
jgi:cobalt-zinc-cadmium efflux system protein